MRTCRGDSSDILLVKLPVGTLFWVLNPREIAELWQVTSVDGRHCLVWQLLIPDEYGRSDSYQAHTTWEPEDTVLVPDEDGQTVLEAAVATQWSDVLIAQAMLMQESLP